MENKVVLIVIGAIAGGIVTYIVRILLFKLDILKSVATQGGLDRIGDIQALLENEGVRKIIEFFKDKEPDSIFKAVEGITNLNQNLEKQSADIEKINGYIVDRIFNKLTGRLHDSIESNTKFSDRLKISTDSKLYLASNCSTYPKIQSIFSSDFPIFIESGSTLGYCVLPLVDKFLNKSKNTSSKPRTICTNNVVVYMILLFQPNVLPVLLPGTPTNKYAATFGTKFHQKMASNHKEGEEEVVDMMVDSDEVMGFLKEHEVQAIFSTASVLDVKYGPHVSSTANWSIKRVLNDYCDREQVPNFFVVISENINCHVEEKKTDKDCKLIFSDSSAKSVLDDPKELKAVHSNFRKYLRNQQSYILTGSNNEPNCKQVINLFKRTYGSELDIYEHSDQEGLISVIQGTDPGRIPKT